MPDEKESKVVSLYTDTYIWDEVLPFIMENIGIKSKAAVVNFAIVDLYNKVKTKNA